MESSQQTEPEMRGAELDYLARDGPYLRATSRPGPTPSHAVPQLCCMTAELFALNKVAPFTAPQIGDSRIGAKDRWLTLLSKESQIIYATILFTHVE